MVYYADSPFLFSIWYSFGVTIFCASNVALSVLFGSNSIFVVKLCRKNNQHKAFRSGDKIN